MVKELVKIANRLDTLGLTKEADVLDRWVEKHIKLAAKYLSPGSFYFTRNNGAYSILFLPSDGTGSSTTYKSFSKCSHNGTHAFDIIDQQKKPFSVYVNDVIVSSEEALKMLELKRGYYVVRDSDDDVTNNNYYFYDGEKVSKVGAKSGLQPIAARDFLISGVTYDKISDTDYAAIANATKPDEPVGPVAQGSTLPVMPNTGEELWADKAVKDKWIQRSTKLRRYTTQQNFNLWLERKKKAGFPNGMTKEQVIAELDKDMQSAAK